MKRQAAITASGHVSWRVWAHTWHCCPLAFCLLSCWPVPMHLGDPRHASIPDSESRSSSRCSDDGLGAIQPGRFPSGRMTWWISLLQAIRDQDFRDLALEAQMLLQVFAPHLPIAGVQIELLPQRQATSLT